MAEEQQLRLRSEADKDEAQQTSQQLALLQVRHSRTAPRHSPTTAEARVACTWPQPWPAWLQAQCSPKAVEARVEARVEATCQQRVASAELEARKRADDAVRATRQLKAKLEAQAARPRHYTPLAHCAPC